MKNRRFQRNFKPKPPINDNIRSREVRVVGEDINEIMARDKAVILAKNQGEDLVCINFKSDPPICKIMDYGKYAYEQKKKKKLQDKKNRENAVEIKEIQFRPSIDIGDIMTKVRKIQEFIDDGDKVKLVMKMRGREMSMKDFCNEQFDKFLSNVKDYDFDSKPKWLGNKVLAILKKSASI
tara:strand:+ start:1323 stop:1862 length:540 start_codon:yes stop_codon:yes gene_type:complete